MKKKLVYIVTANIAEAIAYKRSGQLSQGCCGSMDRRNCLRYVIRIAIGISIQVLFLIGNCATASTITVPTDYANIQWAIDNATAGDTIEVQNGTYFENVNVTKKLILRGVGVPVVDAGYSGIAITLAADGIMLDGFSVANGCYWDGGIKIISNNNTLIGNNANGIGGEGLCIGIFLSSSNNNTLIGNNANNRYSTGVGGYRATGIFLSSSNNNTLIDNNANWNIGKMYGDGIFLSSSSNNTLISNNANWNSGSGIRISGGSNNTMIDNNANWNSADSCGIGIALGGSNNVLIGNNANGNPYVGIEIGGSNNTLSGNNVNSNGGDWCGGIGIALGGSNNVLFGNVANNNIAGISPSSSSNNLIYNNIFNNTDNVLFDGSNINRWNITKQRGTNIVGGSFLVGNFWANPEGTGFSQTCSDVKSDGICDKPLVLDGNNIDYLPLSIEPPSISFTILTPANGAILTQNYVYINTTVNDAATAFIDWNRSLVGWWRFNNESSEKPSFFRDSSSWGNNGTCSGVNCPSFTSGKFGNALNFDGLNDYVDAGNDASLNITDAITIEAWINPAVAQEKCWDGVSGNYGVMGKVSAPANSVNWSWQLKYGAPGGGCYLGFQFNANPEGSRWVRVKQNMTAGQWYHVVGTFDGTDIKSYLNGDLKDSNKISAIKGNRNKLIIGSEGWANYFNGKIDEVRIFNRALSPDEIKAAYDAGINSLFNNFTNLPSGVYNYQAYAQNLAGAMNQTEARSLNLNSIATPSISFINPTPANGATLGQNYVFINTTVTNVSTSFIDWNRSLGGWLRFNGESGENSTVFRDWSSWGNNGTCSEPSCPTSAPGKFGNALDFDGSNDYLNMDNAGNFKDDITIMAWINPRTTGEGGSGRIVSKNDAAGYVFYINNAAGLGWMINTTSIVETTSGSIPYNTWSHVVATFDKDLVSTQLKIYINGVIKGNGTRTAAMPTNSNPLLIGNRIALDRTFNGRMDDIRIFNRALSPDEIKASYDAGSYRLFNNFTNLPAGVYNYTAYGQDLSGNVNQTETRTLNLNLIAASSISFRDPTPANGATLIQNYAYINTTVSDSSTAFFDWNHSLVGWWRFNSESGENLSFFRDWGSWGNNLTCSGVNCPFFTSGKFGNALNFDGSNDYVTVPNSAILNPSNITLEVWFNANSGGLAGQKSLIQKPYTSRASPYYQYMLSLEDTVG